MADDIIIHADCRHFMGHIPCKPHKDEGVHCDGCQYYDQVKERILIIKLGALGDVIRTTPIIEALKQQYPQGQIFWLTEFPEILPSSVDRALPYELSSIVFLEQVQFDLLINLDKDADACALAARLSARTKLGFTLIGGVPAPANEAARAKFLTGIFDDASRANRLSYPEELMAICGYRFNGQRYAIAPPSGDYTWALPEGNGAVVGLNTGCGTRWTTRNWPDEHWAALAAELLESGYRVLLLGGPDEHEKNVRLGRATGAWYEGTYALDQFSDLVNQCQLVVTVVTMTLHLAIALGKKVVLFNNIFNASEFEMYGQGPILEPPDCTCFYAHSCDKMCMADLKVERVRKAILEALPAA